MKRIKKISKLIEKYEREISYYKTAYEELIDNDNKNFGYMVMLNNYIKIYSNVIKNLTKLK